MQNERQKLVKELAKEVLSWKRAVRENSGYLKEENT